MDTLPNYNILHTSHTLLVIQQRVSKELIFTAFRLFLFRREHLSEGERCASPSGGFALRSMGHQSANDPESRALRTLHGVQCQRAQSLRVRRLLERHERVQRPAPLRFTQLHLVSCPRRRWCALISCSSQSHSLLTDLCIDSSLEGTSPVVSRFKC